MSEILAGKTIAVTASRRAEEQAAAFERHGAFVIAAPTVRIVKTEDDALLLDETRQVLEHPPQLVLVTTGNGLKGWLETADKTELGAPLREALASAQILVRGAKGRGAVRSLGFDDSGVAAEETTESLVELAVERGVAGKNVTIQQHGKPDPALVSALERAGATVVQIHPNRWEDPKEPAKAEALIDSVIAGEVDVITFTAAPAFEAMMHRAEAAGKRHALVDALRHMTVAAVGPVTAEPMLALGLEPLVPERSRMGAMIKQVVAHLEGEGSQAVGFERS